MKTKRTPKKKVESPSKINMIKASPEQIEDLKNALRSGAPLTLALQYSGISRATYFYWVAVASIVIQAKSQEELEGVERYINSGVSLQTVRDMSENIAAEKRTGCSVFIEPSAESVLNYKNNIRFRNFANKVYEIVSECDRIRSKTAINHLLNIQKATSDRRINPSGSMWFLERTMSDFFAKPSDKAKEENSEKVKVEPVRVEFVNPDTPETKDRIAQLEAEIMEGGKGTA